MLPNISVDVSQRTYNRFVKMLKEGGYPVEYIRRESGSSLYIDKVLIGIGEKGIGYWLYPAAFAKKVNV